MRHNLTEEVGAIMRAAAAEAILPRFNSLRATEAKEKTPGEPVTVADREAERILSSALIGLVPGSTIVGEELAAEQPEILNYLGGERVWLVDPLDGTANFIAGSPCFAVMVALLVNGEAAMAWILDPINDVLAVAERGAGAFIGSARVRTSAASPGAQSLRGAVSTKFLPPDLQARVANRSHLVAEVLPGMRCAGKEYPAIATGQEHFAFFWRTLPWDHAPGVLFLTEAGGHAARLDGEPYRPVDRRPGLLAAQNHAVWIDAHTALV